MRTRPFSHGAAWALAILASALPACTYPAVTALATTAAETVDEFDAIVEDSARSVWTEKALGIALDQSGADTLPERPWTSDDEQAMLEINDGVRAYFEVLASLADDDVVNFDAELDGLAAPLKPGKVSEEAIGSYGALVKITASAVGGWIRHRALCRALRDAAPQISEICTLYRVVGKGYRNKLKRERSQLDMLPPDARVARTADVDRRMRHAEAFLVAVEKLEATLAQVAIDPSDLDGDRIKQLVGEYRRDVEPSTRVMRSERGGRVRSRIGGRR